jgi:hypothetical protein
LFFYIHKFLFLTFLTLLHIPAVGGCITDVGSEEKIALAGGLAEMVQWVKKFRHCIGC